MFNRKEVATKEAGSVEKSDEQVRAIRPLVNIFENEKGITVQADMPGVSKERLDIQIDKDTLSIEGVSEVPMPEGMEALHADICSTHYRRNFSLSSELDGERADASLKDGVLTLSIPKREQFKPRKIDVRVH
jgi:HSP20 family molecular chaperone IbpA